LNPALTVSHFGEQAGILGMASGLDLDVLSPGMVVLGVRVGWAGLGVWLWVQIPTLPTPARVLWVDDITALCLSFSTCKEGVRVDPGGP
jgi:hypothetical protein